MEILKERFEKRLELCNKAIDAYRGAMNSKDVFAISDSRSELINQLLCYQLDAKYYITELEAEIRANERYIQRLKEDRDEAWRFCKL